MGSFRLQIIFKPVSLPTGPPPTLRVETNDDRTFSNGDRDRGTSREEAHGGDTGYTDYESFLREVGNSINRVIEGPIWDRDSYDYRGWEVEELEDRDGVGMEEEEEGEGEGGAERNMEEEVMAVSTTPS